MHAVLQTRTAEGAASLVAMQDRCRPLYDEQSWVKLISYSQAINISLPLRAVYLAFFTDGSHKHLANKAACNARADCYFEKNCRLCTQEALFVFGATVPSGLGPPHSRSF